MGLNRKRKAKFGSARERHLNLTIMMIPFEHNNYYRMIPLCALA